MQTFVICIKHGPLDGLHQPAPPMASGRAQGPHQDWGGFIPGEKIFPWASAQDTWQMVAWDWRAASPGADHPQFVPGAGHIQARRQLH